MKINGIEYGSRDLDFINVICDLEDKGIDIMRMSKGQGMNLFSLSRAIVSAYTGEKDLTECGKIVTEHLRGGGKLDDIIDGLTEDMEKAGFGSAAKQTAEPQDHKKPSRSKASATE